MKIVVLDGYGMNPGDLSWDALKELGDVTIYDRTTEEEVYKRCADADIVLTNKVVFDANTIWDLPNLKYIGVLATGYNVIDTVAAKDCGIVVTNIPAYSTDSVAQNTFAHILAIANRVEHYSDQNRNGRWSSNPDFVYWDTPLVELAGKNLGLVGLGRIGMKVAHIALCFGMEVFAVTSKHRIDLPEGIRKTTLDGLLATSDILSLHCPLNNETREMINAKSIKKMKRGAIIINTGRGPLVNEADVAEALKSGQLGAYGADVMCQEPPEADNPLFAAPNVFITPHIAWATFEARTRLMQIAVDNVKAFIDGQPINVVNK
ncbi:MAG: D-2-hydroxyacid dehydrogenase [Prevotellaceae bacterium]|nr:D-2-hydroxyacid dehydrogenase [Prevotellaceae bacterium]